MRALGSSSVWVPLSLLGLSVAAHVAVVWVMPQAVSRAQARDRVEMEFLAMERPPPKAEVPRVQPRPTPMKTTHRATARQPVAQVAAEAPPADPVVGVTSPTDVGTLVVPEGNTTLGTPDPAPPRIAPPGPAKIVPAGSADLEPELGHEITPPYPPEARAHDIEGRVRLQVTVDAEGRVTHVLVLSGPGYGLNEAARDAMLRARFRPAMKDGRAVGTTILYTYSFVLD